MINRLGFSSVSVKANEGFNLPAKKINFHLTSGECSVGSVIREKTPDGTCKYFLVTETEGEKINCTKIIPQKSSFSKSDLGTKLDVSAKMDITC